MGEKKNGGRFCVQLNLNDPRHRQVAQLLEEQGRRKAQFIVEAVLKSPATTDTANLQQMIGQLLAQQTALVPPNAPSCADDDLKSAIQGAMANWG